MLFSQFGPCMQFILKVTTTCSFHSSAVACTINRSLFPCSFFSIRAGLSFILGFHLSLQSLHNFALWIHWSEGMMFKLHFPGISSHLITEIGWSIVSGCIVWNAMSDHNSIKSGAQAY